MIRSRVGHIATVLWDGFKENREFIGARENGNTTVVSEYGRECFEHVAGEERARRLFRASYRT